MIRRFLRDVDGSYAIATIAALVPIIGGLALAVDYSQMIRQKEATRNALDAAGIAAARELVSGKTDEAVIAYARNFFEANLGPVSPADAVLTVNLPTNTSGGGTLKLSAQLEYKPMFLPVFREIIGSQQGSGTAVAFNTSSEIRLKNTLEVALVLDNSGSMDYWGSGSSQKRIDLLKDAAKKLVDTIALQAAIVKQVNKPVQFALVPFAGSVNVGATNAAASWMDTTGISPVHHENFDWTTLDDPDRSAALINGVWKKAGIGWGAEEGEILTRFTLFDETRKEVENEDDSITIESFAGWAGCVEARPPPYNINDKAPTTSEPATLFVPMFAPDEPGDRWETEADENPEDRDSSNNWWNDGVEGVGGRPRLRNMTKYFDTRPHDVRIPSSVGPNYSCTTKAITPLTDVTTEAGLTAVKSAIDAMRPNGATNVPEGMAWGWRSISSGEPFAGGRAEAERGNDKVVIVLTDGENTYYTPGSLGFDDDAGMRSTYSAHGYLQPGYNGTGVGRLLSGTSDAVGKYDYSNSNYTRAMNEHMATLCQNAKDAGIIVMTVALDLSSTHAGQAAAINALKSCASDSRFRKDENGHPTKLFWNATGSSLSEDFEEIADELSNLRIIS